MGLRTCLACTCAGVLVAASLAGPLAPRAGATSLSDFTVFGGTGVSIWEGSTVNGQVGSNSAVSLYGSGISTGSVLGEVGFFSLGGNSVGGDVNFNGGVFLGAGDVVQGNVLTSEYGFFGAGAQVNGSVIWPGSYSAVALPPTMYPGHLPAGSMAFPSDPIVELSSGDYRYTTINRGTLTLRLNPAGGLIYVHVDTDVTLGTVQLESWDGAAYAPYGQAIADPALRGLADQVYFETAGGWASAGEWFGQIYAPEGSVFLGAGSNVTGSLWAGQDVYVHGGSDVNVIPEPVTAVGLVLGISALAGWVRRRRAAKGALA
jgi:hypothetical protein